MSEPTRRPLPVIVVAGAPHGGRDRMTCLYRCGTPATTRCRTSPTTSTSVTSSPGELSRRDGAARRRRRRRRRRSGGAARSRHAGAGGARVGTLAAPHSAGPRRAVGATPRGSALTFTAVPPNRLDTVVGAQRLRPRGGHPLGRPGACPARRASTSTTRPPAAQRQQFGYNNDFVAVLPLDRRRRPGAARRQPRVHQRGAHVPRLRRPDALTVEQLRDRHGRARPVRRGDRAGRPHRPVAAGHPRPPAATTGASPRIDPRSRCTGPAAGSAAAADRRRPDRHGRSLGTLNNCAGGITPWGTVLSGEENFNQYFVGGDGGPGRRTSRARPVRHRHRDRYPSGSRKWDRVDERFDLAQHPNEAQPLRLDRGDRPVRPRLHAAQAHRARPVQARGRQRHARPRRPRRSPTWATTSGSTTSTSSSPTRRCDRSRSDRAPTAQPDAARVGHALRGQAHRRHLGRRDRRHRHAAGRRRVRRHRHLDPAGRRRTSRSCPGMTDRGGAGLHPARRRRGRRDQDGPSRGRRAQPGHRQGLRRR